MFFWQHDRDQLNRIERKLNQVIAHLGIIETMEAKQMADLSALEAEVAENNDAIQSAISLLNTLSDELRAVATDPAAVQALADQLDAQTNALAAAVVANTPADPNTEPPPEG